MHTRERFNTNACHLISSLIIASLIGCTGSFEGGNSSARLVFAVPAASIINCLNDGGTSLPVTVNIGLLITNTNLEQGNQLSNCTSVAIESAPYDLVTTPAGDRIILSLPGKGRLEVRSNKTNVPILAKLQAKAGTGPFCPTRLALSPDARRVAVLDDPDDTTARSFGCSNNENRAPRVLVFDLSSITASTSTLEPIRVATGDLSGTFQSARSAGPLTMTLNDSQAFVIAPITTYGIFKLNKDNDLRVNPQALNLAGLSINDNSLRLDLTTIFTGAGTRLLLSFSTNSGAGGAYFIDPNSNTLTPEPVALNGRPLTATTRAVWNKRPNDSLIAYLQPNQVVFQRLTGTIGNSKALSVSNPSDATFTSDGYAWVLQPGSVSRFDVTNLATVNTPSSVFWTLSARAIGTFIQQ